jgi:hypothetical protein
LTRRPARRGGSVSGVIIRQANGGPVLTAIIVDAGDREVKRFVEFFNATIRNRYLARVGPRCRSNFGRLGPRLDPGRHRSPSPTTTVRVDVSPGLAVKSWP